MHKQILATKAWQGGAGALFAVVCLARRWLWVVAVLALVVGNVVPPL